MELFVWINQQLLRMDWLSALVRWLLEAGLGLDTATRLGASIHFFIYDVIKIFILLGVLIFAISWVQSYFPPERTRRILGGLRGVRANLMGALLGLAGCGGGTDNKAAAPAPAAASGPAAAPPPPDPLQTMPRDCPPGPRSGSMRIWWSGHRWSGLGRLPSVASLPRFRSPARRRRATAASARFPP